MADGIPGAAPSPPDRTTTTRLDSWKEIATHLKRDVTTVRRWELREGLPVHRHQHERRDSVYAYVSEIDDWHKRRNAIVPKRTRSMARTLAQSAGWAWLVATTFFTTTVALGVLLLTQGSTVESPVEHRYSVQPPAGTSFRDMVVSPDGRYFAFTAVPSSSTNGKSTLWVQPSNSLEARALPNTENARLPFWSPASNALGFFADGHLWITDLSGRNPHSLALAPDGRGGTWNRDGTIVFAPERAGPLSRVASAGGAAKVITALHQGEWGHAWPSFLPDGRHFTYLAHPGSRPHEGHHVFVEALDGSVRRQILAAESGVLHSGDGYLLYQRQRQLLAQPFDLHQFTLTGEPVAVAPDVLQLYPYPSRWQFSVSSHGTLTYRTPQSPAVRLVWRDRTGRSSPLLDTPADISDPALSPNETRVAYSVFEREPSTRHGYGPSDIVSNLYILDRTTGLQSRLVSDPAMESAVVWSPNGKSIVYYSTGGDDSTELLLKDTNDPRAAAVPLATQGFNPAATSWSHDGRFLAYATFERTTKGDVWLLPMSGDRTPIPVLQSRFNEEQGQISPDGRWMAYTSDESGRAEVWVTMLPKATTKWRVSSSGAGDPRWRPDGTELYYITEDRQLMAVPVKRGTIFEFGEAVPLFDTGVPPHWYNARNLYDVARDGRFLFMSPVEDDRSAPVTVVLDWTALLRK